MPGTLRFLLGDQLSRSISSLDGLDPDNDVVVMAEVGEEATYVRHHKKKIAFLFAAMRHFADELRGEGIAVDYAGWGEAGGPTSLTEALRRAVERRRPERIVVTEPGEWRVLQMMRDWSELFGCPVEIRQDGRFLCPTEDFARWAEGRKDLRMEFFYREMRRRTGYLMRGKDPEGGAWNFDKENRKALPETIAVPERPRFTPDATTRRVLDLVARDFAEHFGDLEPFDLPVTRADALKALDWFVEHALPLYGDYQDAMRTGEPLLFHSNLSAAINCGLLLPAECCRRAEDAWHAGRAPLNAVEGFIRQIIGWREYVRGIYWLRMPDYAEANALGADRPLPDFFWTAETDMNCMAQAIGETKANAYAHHIQRLMVIGNFCLLAGLDPRAVQAWYLLVYADAYEWVEMPNVVGMILFADGGLLASKPYAASGAYIDRMSDYCDGCRYDVKQRSGPDACPFNPLYWDFLARHRDRFAKNRRMTMMIATLDRMEPVQLAAMRATAGAFLDDLR
ncbi:MAG: cryptochrome/photolyase family protein [Mesorhizobium sp.]